MAESADWMGLNDTAEGDLGSGKGNTKHTDKPPAMTNPAKLGLLLSVWRDFTRTVIGTCAIVTFHV